MEIAGAFVACAMIVTSPVWLALLMRAFGLPALPAFIVGVVVVVVWPTQMPVPGQIQLDAYGRWGANVGRALRAPLSWTQRRRQERRGRALGAASASSTAAPALTSARLDR